LRQGRAPQSGLAVTQRLSRAPGEYRVRTIAARVAGQLKQAGVPVRAGERLRFLLVPGPARARPWELLPDVIPYDRDAYCELLLRAVETVLTPAGVDRGMLENWLIANAGYWGPPGALPPPGADPAEPLFHAQPAQPAAQKRLKASNAARC